MHSGKPGRLSNEVSCQKGILSSLPLLEGERSLMWGFISVEIHSSMHRVQMRKSALTHFQTNISDGAMPAHGTIYSGLGTLLTELKNSHPF